MAVTAPAGAEAGRYSRAAQRAALQAGPETFDVLVIGGGATGAGIVLAAAARGYRSLLLERGDFGAGTSSASSKLIHGGVRYLAQGRFSLVREALQERAILQRNAPALVRPLDLVVPAQGLFNRLKYRIGLGLYDLMAGRGAFHGTGPLTPGAIRRAIPNLAEAHCSGAFSYRDGQFDDTALLIAALRSAVDAGAVVLNYAEVRSLARTGDGRVHGVVAHDLEADADIEVNARVVINATGAGSDRVRAMAASDSQPIVTASRGSHVVVPQRYLGGASGLLIPETVDGRVLFALPWHGKLILGTTDVPATPGDPGASRPQESEIAFILDTARPYLREAPEHGDVSAVFAGLRPLFGKTGSGGTGGVSREHHIEHTAPGLVTITGGKWTTFRRMAEDCVDQLIAREGLAPRPAATAGLTLNVSDIMAQRFEPAGAPAAISAASLARQVAAAVGDEFAVHVDDVLARRLRWMMLDVEAVRPLLQEAAAQVSANTGGGTRREALELARGTAALDLYQP